MPIHDVHWRPVPSAGRPCLGERPQQAQAAATRALHDAGADGHHPEAGVGGWGARGFPVRDHAGQESVSARAVLGERLICPARPVVADRRCGNHDGRTVRGTGGKLGEPAGRGDPGFPDDMLVVGGEPAGDRGSGQVHQRADAAQQARIGVIRDPAPFAVVCRCAADQPDHLVAAAGQEGGQRRADEPGTAGHGDGQWLAPDLPDALVGREVTGHLAVPVGHHRVQQPGGDRRGDAIGDPRRTGSDGGELMRVPPRQHGT